MTTFKTEGFGCLLFSLFALACGGEPTYQFCENEDAIALEEPCDITEKSCQKAVFKAAKCVNGSRMPMPPIRIISEADYLSEIRTPKPDLIDGGVNGDNETGTDSIEDTEWPNSDVDFFDESLRLLGLLEPIKSMKESVDDEYTSSILAYYSWEFQDVTLITKEESGYYTDSILTLAHEFTHAIQDYEVGLAEQSELYSHDDDILIAREHSYEGDAQVRADFAYALLAGVDVNDMYTRDYYMMQLSWMKKAAAAASSPYPFLKKALAYSTGALYVFDTYQKEGLEGIDRLRQHFPTSTVYWMAGYDASHSSVEVFPTGYDLPLTCVESMPPKGYEKVHQDRLGAAMLYGVLSSKPVGGIYHTEEAWDRALQWRGDALNIYREIGGDSISALWHLRVATGADAKKLKKKLSKRLPDGNVIRIKDEILVFLANDMSVLESWVTSYSCDIRRD